VKSFSERSPLMIGLTGTLVVIAIMIAALNFDKLPFFNSDAQYSAYFAELADSRPGAPVRSLGYRVGKVSAVELDGARVLIKFAVNEHIHLGRTVPRRTSGQDPAGRQAARGDASRRR